MARKRLTDVLQPTEDTGSMRWRVTVPMGTNPFILIELLQFAITGAAVVLITLATGVWFTEGGVGIEDIKSAMAAAALVVGGITAGFIFFSNRYYVTYHLDPNGIYHEGTRGNDERREWLSLRIRPYPVVGVIKANRTRSRHLVWDKVDRFQDIPNMRVVLLRRGMWHMLRIYTPDAMTHAALVAFLLEKKLTKR